MDAYPPSQTAHVEANMTVNNLSRLNLRSSTSMASYQAEIPDYASSKMSESNIVSSICNLQPGSIPVMRLSYEERRFLASARVVQGNIVCVFNLPPSLEEGAHLKDVTYFGQYGRVVKVTLRRKTAKSKSIGAVSAFIVYQRCEDALRAIVSLSKMKIGGRQLKATLGSAVYCKNTLRGIPCNEQDCVKLHFKSAPEATFSSEQMANGLHIAYQRKKIIDIYQSHFGNKACWSGIPEKWISPSELDEYLNDLATMEFGNDCGVFVSSYSSSGNLPESSGNFNFDDSSSSSSNNNNNNNNKSNVGQNILNHRSCYTPASSSSSQPPQIAYNTGGAAAGAGGVYATGNNYINYQKAGLVANCSRNASRRAADDELSATTELYEQQQQQQTSSVDQFGCRRVQLSARQQHMLMMLRQSATKEATLIRPNSMLLDNGILSKRNLLSPSHHQQQQVNEWDSLPVLDETGPDSAYHFASRSASWPTSSSSEHPSSAWPTTSSSGDSGFGSSLSCCDSLKKASVILHANAHHNHHHHQQQTSQQQQQKQLSSSNDCDSQSNTSQDHASLSLSPVPRSIESEKEEDEMGIVEATSKQHSAHHQHHPNHNMIMVSMVTKINDLFKSATDDSGNDASDSSQPPAVDCIVPPDSGLLSSSALDFDPVEAAKHGLAKEMLCEAALRLAELAVKSLSLVDVNSLPGNSQDTLRDLIRNMNNLLQAKCVSEAECFQAANPSSPEYNYQYLLNLHQCLQTTRKHYITHLQQVHRLMSDDNNNQSINAV